MLAKLKAAMRRAWKAATAALAGLLASVGAFFGMHQGVPAQGAAVVDSLSWTMPTQYTDGSAIPAGTLTGTRIVWGTVKGGPYPNSQDVAVPATTLALTRAGDGTGWRCYEAAALIGTANGLWTAEVCKYVQQAPAAPTNLKAQ